jgi:hypothetical protein
VAIPRGLGARVGRALPRYAEGVAAGISGQGTVDASGEVEDFFRVQHAQQAVTHDLNGGTGQCSLLDAARSGRCPIVNCPT